MEARQHLIFFVAASSYIIQMMIIPKVVSISLVCFFAVVLMFQFFNEQKKKHRIFIPEIAKKFAPFYIYVLISCLWTINKELFTFALIRAMLSFEFAWFISYNTKNEQDIQSTLKGMMFGGIISSCVVLYFQHSFIGVIRLGENIYGSAMEYSGGIVIANIASIMMWAIKKEKKYLLFSLAFFIMCGLSGSRSALVLPLLFMGGYYSFYKQNIIHIAKIGVILVLCGGLIFITAHRIPIFYEVVGKRIDSLLDKKQEDWSAIERKELKKLAWNIWLENPLFGLGCYGFGKANEAKTGKNMHSHCDYAELFSCYGLVGAGLFYIPFFLLLRRKKILLYSKNNIYFCLSLSFIVTMAIHSSTTIFYINIKEMIMVGIIFFVIQKTHARCIQ